MATTQELQDQIRVLQGMKGMESEVKKKQAELAAMTGNGAIAGAIVLPVSVEDFEKSGSKFAAAGLHISEFGMPSWDTVGVSLAFPFTIVEEGTEKGKESKISAGVNAKAVWKIKEILTALGVPYGKDAKGQVTFNPMDVVGKQGKTLWTKQLDTRSPEEGGKGGTYTKATSVVALNADVADLGIG